MNNHNAIQNIVKWFDAAMPNPTKQNLNVQIGVHVEEFVEMLETIEADNSSTEFLLQDLIGAARSFALLMKKGGGSVTIANRVKFLDAVGDQIVTATGCGTLAGMDVVGGVNEIVGSNWSKFDDEGFPIFNEFGKIAKGPNYFEPSLEQFVNPKRDA